MPSPWLALVPMTFAPRTEPEEMMISIYDLVDADRMPELTCFFNRMTLNRSKSESFFLV